MSVFLRFIFIISFLFAACSESNFTPSELDKERAVAEEQRQIVENLKKQIAAEQQRSQEAIPAQVETQRSEISNMSTLMSELRDAQAGLNENVSQAVDREKFEVEAARNQIIPLMQSLEQNIPHTEEQITLLLGYSYRTPEQETRLKDLQSEITAEKQQLNYLKGQLTALNANSINRMYSLFSQAQDQKRELASYRENLQNELQSRQETVSALLSQTLQSRMSLMMLNQQLRNAEKNYETQQQKVKSLEAQSATPAR
jgi:chromosome segregation ATPase